MSSILGIGIGCILSKIIAEMALEWLNRRWVKRSDRAVYGDVDTAIYQKTVAYALANNSYRIVEVLLEGSFLVLLFFYGVLPFLYESWIRVMGVSVWSQGAFLFVFTVGLAIVGLPLEWWRQFRLEERFGFNRSTFSLWIADKGKAVLLGFILGYPLLVVLLWIFERLPQTWWIWAAGVWIGFQLLMVGLYPLFIMPLFNRFTELPEGDLKQRLMKLASALHFKTRSIRVMDGSKRSGHSNAFFCGWGEGRRIVLFDTLMDQLDPEAIEAVLAHEIGHYKLGHIPKRLVVALVLSFVAFAVLGKLAGAAWFFEGFGFQSDTGIAPVFLLFGLLGGSLSFWLTPWLNRGSRKHEFEADAFAQNSLKGKQVLIRALKKLSKNNLTYPDPHPLYSGFYYSHPTLVERERALKQRS